MTADRISFWRVAMSEVFANIDTSPDRRFFIGGSDARIIMGDDETALLRLWGKSAARSRRKT
jgi:hypothetical protein